MEITELTERDRFFDEDEQYCVCGHTYAHHASDPTSTRPCLDKTKKPCSCTQFQSHAQPVWYRYVDCSWDRKKPYLEELRVIRATPSGVWLDVYGKPRLVIDRCTKQFAHRTPVEARKAYLFRKMKQIEILTDRLASAKESLEAAKRLYTDVGELPHYHPTRPFQFLSSPH